MYLILEITADYEDGDIGKHTKFFKQSKKAHAYYRECLIDKYNGDFSIKEQKDEQHIKEIQNWDNVQLLQKINELQDVNYDYQLYLIECVE